MLTNINLWQFFGGLGLLLFSMNQIEMSLTNIGSQSFKKFLIRNTKSPMRSVVSGCVTTAMLQSSSLVGLLALAFTGAGLIALENALGILLGSNLGTTLTGWVVATIGFKFDLESMALPIIAIGSLVSIINKERQKELGRVTVAIGLLILGLSFMKASVDSLSSQFDINTLMDFSLLQFVLFGALFAAVVQSSSATMIIALAALNANIISLPSAAAIAIGADLGTSSTIILGAINGVPNKKRVAASQVFINIITNVVALIFLFPLLRFIKFLGIHDPLFSLVAFHSLFNFISILIFLPLIKPMANVLKRLYIDKKTQLSKFINQITPTVNEAGLLAIRQETVHLLQRIILTNLSGFGPDIKVDEGQLPFDNSEAINFSAANRFMRAYKENKALEGEILIFSTDLQHLSLDVNESSELGLLLSSIREALHSSKNIKDVQANLNDFILSNKIACSQFSNAINTLMSKYYSQVFMLKANNNDLITIDELQEFSTMVRTMHTELHNKIIQDIHERRIVETEGSSMLNVNHELLNSNLALINSLNFYVQSRMSNN